MPKIITIQTFTCVRTIIILKYTNEKTSYYKYTKDKRMFLLFKILFLINKSLQKRKIKNGKRYLENLPVQIFKRKMQNVYEAKN